MIPSTVYFGELPAVAPSLVTTRGGRRKVKLQFRSTASILFVCVEGVNPREDACLSLQYERAEPQVRRPVVDAKLICPFDAIQGGALQNGEPLRTAPVGSCESNLVTLSSKS